jgi:hypothetical protein
MAQLSSLEVWTLINNGLAKYQQDNDVDLVQIMAPYGFHSLEDIAQEFFVIAHGESSFDPSAVGDTNDPFGMSVGLWQSNLQHYGNPGETNKLGYTQGEVLADPIKQIETAINDAVTRTTFTGQPDIAGQPFSDPFIAWSVYKDRFDGGGGTSLYNTGVDLYDLFSSNNAGNTLPDPAVSNPSTQPTGSGTMMGLTEAGLGRYTADLAAYNEQDLDAIEEQAGYWDTYAVTLENLPEWVDTGDTPEDARAKAAEIRSGLLTRPNVEDYYEVISTTHDYTQPAPQFQVQPTVTQAELDQDRWKSTALLGRNIMQGLPTGEAQMNVSPEVYQNLMELGPSAGLDPALLFGGPEGGQLATPTMDTIAKATPMERENWNATASMFELPDFTDLAGATKRRWSGRKETGSGLMNTAPRPARPSIGGLGGALGSVRRGALGTPNRTPTNYRSPNSPSRNKAAAIRSGRAGQIRSSR